MSGTHGIDALRGGTRSVRRALFAVGAAVVLLASISAAPASARDDVSCPPQAGGFEVDPAAGGPQDMDTTGGLVLSCTYVTPDGDYRASMSALWQSASFPDPAVDTLQYSCRTDADPHVFVSSSTSDAYVRIDVPPEYDLVPAMLAAASSLLSSIEPVARPCPVAEPAAEPTEAAAPAPAAAAASPAGVPAAVEPEVGRSEPGGSASDPASASEDGLDPAALALAVGLLFALLGIGGSLAPYMGATHEPDEPEPPPPIPDLPPLPDRPMSPDAPDTESNVEFLTHLVRDEVIDRLK
ncbi:MAG TPA: hypothetical protein VIM26_06135, partial [Pengzhenrongella sp.]